MDESNAFRRKTGRLAGIWKLQRVMEIEKSTVCPLESGTGDGNRTHVRSLGRLRAISIIGTAISSRSSSTLFQSRPNILYSRRASYCAPLDSPGTSPRQPLPTSNFHSVRVRRAGGLVDVVLSETHFTWLSSIRFRFRLASRTHKHLLSSTAPGPSGNQTISCSWHVLDCVLAPAKSPLVFMHIDDENLCPK